MLIPSLLTNLTYLVLAQLYQLRGRVGRSATQAFAYLMLDKNIKINDERLDRLKKLFHKLTD